jgi:thymidylate synthase (FAD)
VPRSNQWRLAPEDKKQGSAGLCDPFTGAALSEQLIRYIEQGEAYYNLAMESGIAPEQARLFLPAYSMHVVYRWSCSLQSACLFLVQRLEEQAQEEIRDYAEAVLHLIKDLYPVSIKALVGKYSYA